MLFFLPFFQLWVSVKILLLVGVLYAFLFVPLLVGLVKQNLTEQQIVISRVKWNIRWPNTPHLTVDIFSWRILKAQFVSHLKQFVRISSLLLICAKEHKLLTWAKSLVKNYSLQSSQIMKVKVCWFFRKFWKLYRIYIENIQQCKWWQIK